MSDPEIRDQAIGLALEEVAGDRWIGWPESLQRSQWVRTNSQRLRAAFDRHLAALTDTSTQPRNGEHE